MKLFTAVIITVLSASVLSNAQSRSSAISSLTEIRSGTINNVIDIDGPVILKKGKWSGKPFVKGGAERPSVHLIEEMVLSGDVNGDRIQDAAVFLASSTGGSASQVSLALFLRDRSSLKNMATLWLGDRVQIRSARIDSTGSIEMTIIRVGEGDSYCCPGEFVQRRWKWNGTSLSELPERIIGRSNVAALEGVQWRLEEWKQGEPVDTNTAVTLQFADRKVSGRSACNQYFAGVKDGTLPGEIVISAGGSTKMMCSPELMATEDRFLRLLPSVVHYRFSFSVLHLEYDANGVRHSLIFKQDTNE